MLITVLAFTERSFELSDHEVIRHCSVTSGGRISLSLHSIGPI